MLPLGLFAVRNFAVGNLATLAIYGALGIVTFLVTIYLQQVAGYSAVAAGSALLPITVVMWLLSKRFGRLSDSIGPRALMGIGPLVAGAGMLWMGRAGGTVDYARDLLPGVLLFGLGLAMTVAPLTTTVLGAVDERRAGVASGVNNAVSRVAALLAIAALGAVVGARYTHELDTRAARLELDAGQRRDLSALRARPLAGAAEDPELRAVVRESSVAAYRWGVSGGGLLMVLGGTISLVGIVNPRRPAEESAAATSARAVAPLAE
jgi:hypothetical protein